MFPGGKKQTEEHRGKPCGHRQNIQKHYTELNAKEKAYNFVVK